MNGKQWLRVLGAIMTVLLVIDTALMVYKADRPGEPPLPWWAFALCLIGWLWIIVLIGRDISDTDRSKT